MKKKNLVFDFDDTIVISLPLLIEFMNKTWSIKSEESDYNGQDMLYKIVQKYTNNPSFTYEDVHASYWNNFALSTEWHDKIMPMPGMSEVVKNLLPKYNLHIATKRSNLSTHLVNKVLNKHIPDCIESVYYATKYIDGIGHLYQTKRDFILGLNGESVGFVDDSPFEIEEMKNAVPSFLFDPRDKHLSRQMDKMRSWEEIGNYFL